MNFKLKRLLPYIIIFLLTAAVYLQNLWFDYSYLDDNLIVFQEHQKINSILNVPASFSGGYLYDNYYRPIVMISFIIDTAIAGTSSTMYHLTNLVLHILVCFLVYLLLKKITKEDFLSLVLTLLFCIHPVNLNAVSWIAGRNDLLVTLFTLLSFLTFIKYCEAGNKRYLLLTPLFYALAMFSKETGIVIPLLLISYLIIDNDYNIKISPKKLRALFLVTIVPASIYFVLRFFVSPVRGNGDISLASFFKNINIPFEYIAKIFYLFGFSALSMANITLIIIGVLVSMAILILLIFNKNIDKKTYGLGLIFFLIFILPPLFVRMPASDGGFNYIDCRLYLPLFGLLLIFISIIKSYKSSSFWKRANLKVFTAAIVSIFFIYVLVINITENQYYRNGRIFWSHILEIYPDRATYWMGLGYYYFDQKEYLKAAGCAERAIMLKPLVSEYYHKAAIAYEKAGDLMKADNIIEKLVFLGKDNSMNLLTLIKNNLKLRDYEKATIIKSELEKENITDLKKKGEIFSSAAAYFIYSQKYEQAIDLMNKASKYQPQNPFYVNDLGVCFYSIGKVDSAKKYFSEAIKLDPYNKDFQKNFHLANK